LLIRRQFAVIDLYQYFDSASTAFLSKKFVADIAMCLLITFLIEESKNDRHAQR